MTNALETALAAYAPEVAARYARMVTNGFNALTEKFGPSMRGVANSTSYKFWGETVRPCTKSEGDKMTSAYVLDADRLAQRSEAYSKLAVESFKVKIEGKMGDLENAEVAYLNGGRFAINGTKAGHKVRIEQEMIVNQSTKGTLFNQFPARIYVDGKFTSEAKFKKMFA